ncbi:MAG: serine acetyltransferase, partial [Fibrobacteria bacterium]
MHRSIQADLYRYTGDGPGRGSLWRGLRNPGFRFTYVFRMAKLHAKYTPLGLFFRFLVNRYFWKYGFQISLKTQLGEGLYIGHIGAVIINSSSLIGKNCNLSAGVTIGQTNRGDKKGSPTIGDRV